jgi:hypothetical protein
VNELAANASAIEHADALDWLARQEPGTATATVFDPPYSRNSPMRGREDGAAGSVAAPFSFMHRTMRLCATAVRPKATTSRPGPKAGGSSTVRTGSTAKENTMAAGDTQITIARIPDLPGRAPIGVAYAECRRRELPSEL